MIVGIDEVGRGSWAGPLVVGAVALGGAEITGLTDSKLLSKKKREVLSAEIKRVAPLVGIGWVSAREIDQIGLSGALRLASRRALDEIDLSDVDQIIIDGTIKLIDDPRVTLMKKADLLVPSVSAASVIAKVARDHYMALCDQVFPGYGFAGHVGYGAATHRTAIEQLGATPIHRMSFEPLKSLYGIDSQVLKDASSANLDRKSQGDKPTSRSIGDHAEDAASEYLEHHGFEIIERNWKTKWCEIDIVAVRRSVVHFVEVKYRRGGEQGGGVAAITPKKLNQMTFAAKLWLHTYGEHDAQLSVIEVMGEDMTVTRFIENVT